VVLIDLHVLKIYLRGLLRLVADLFQSDDLVVQGLPQEGGPSTSFVNRLRWDFDLTNYLPAMLVLFQSRSLESILRLLPTMDFQVLSYAPRNQVVEDAGHLWAALWAVLPGVSRLP
jgi:hypothetical protein